MGEHGGWHRFSRRQHVASAVGTQNGIRLRMSCGDLAPDSIVCHNAKIALGTIVREPQPASLVMFEFCRASYYEDIAHRQFVARHLRGNHQRMQFRSEEHTSELQSLMRISYAV